MLLPKYGEIGPTSTINIAVGVTTIQDWDEISMSGNAVATTEHGRSIMIDETIAT